MHICCSCFVGLWLKTVVSYTGKIYIFKQSNCHTNTIVCVELFFRVKPLTNLALNCVSAALQVFVLLFIIVKRQIVRFAMKSRRGPHVPLGHNAPKVSLLHTGASKQDSGKQSHCDVALLLCSSCALKELRQEIEAKLSHVQKIHFEPRLLSPDDDRLKHSDSHTGERPHTHGRTHGQRRPVETVIVRAGSSDYLYRMRALDAIRAAGEPCRRSSSSSVFCFL